MPSTPTTAQSEPRHRQAPSYAARRMLASAVIITIGLVGAVVTWRTFNDDATTASDVDAEWGGIALVDRTRGDVVTVDTDGATQTELSGFGRIISVHVESDRVALVGPSEIFLGSVIGAPSVGIPASSDTSGPSASEPNSGAPSIPVVPATDEGTTTTPTSGGVGLGLAAGPDNAPSVVPSTTVVPVSPSPSTTAPAAPPPGFVSVPYPRGSQVNRLPIPDRLVLVVGQTQGGNALIIDGDSGSVIDVGGLAGQKDPLLFTDTIRYNPTGTTFALADAGNFQTIVVRTTPAVTIEFFADVPVAVSDRVVVTSQVVGRRADVSFFNHDGRVLDAVSLAIPAGAVLTDRGLLVVSVDGQMTLVVGNRSTPRALGSIDMPADGAVRRVVSTAGGDRLVIVGDTFETVVDLDGATIASSTFDTTRDIADPQPDWRCLTLGDTDQRSLMRLADGEVIADVTGLTITDMSADGCTVIGNRLGVTEVVSADVTLSLGAVRSASLSPDGASVVRVTDQGVLELVTVDEGELGEPMQLSDLIPTATLAVAFIER